VSKLHADVLATIKSALEFFIMAVVSFPVTRQYDVTWSTSPCGLLHCANATGSDVTAQSNHSTLTVTERARWTYYPFTYDSTLGWYTAAIISGLILVFLLCEGFERAKHAIIDCWEARYGMALNVSSEMSAICYEYCKGAYRATYLNWTDTV